MKKIIFITLISSITSYCSAQSIQDARKLTENEQFESATNMYKALIEKTPADASLYYYYGDNLIGADNPDSANMVFSKGTTIEGTNPLLKIGKAKLLLDEINLRESKTSSEKDGSNPELKIRYESAIENIKKANAFIDEAVLNTKNIQVLIEAAEALIHYRNKDLDKAKSLLEKASAIDQKNIEVLILFGDIYTELNNGTLAADYYNRALDLNKSSARAIVSKGRLYKRSTNYESAVQEFENAIKIEPGYAPAHRELGESYIKLGQLAKAKEEYKLYLELSKNNCGARIRYASFLFLSKNYNEAISELNQVQQRCDSNNLSLLRIQTYCYYEAKEFEKGIQTVNHLFGLLPPEKRTATDYEYYGKLLLKSKRDSLGIEQLQKAFAIDPTRIDLLSDMADAWINIKQYDNAIELLNQKMKLGKDAKVTDYYSLARAYYYSGKLTEADSMALKTNEMNPKWASAWMLRSQINAHIDSSSQDGRAKPFYEKFIEIAVADSANPAKYQKGLIESYGYLAYFYILKKDNANALVFLKKKMELPLDADDKKNVQQAIDQLEGRGPKGNKK